MNEKRTHPDLAEEALDALRRTPAQPDPGRMALEQQAFLAQARQIRQQGVSRRAVVRHRRQTLQLLQKGWANMTGLVRALLVLTLLSGSAVGTAAAADASLPGQPLYGLDGALEQVQVQMATSTQQRARLALHLAEERAIEIDRLAEAGTLPTEAQLDRLQTQLQTALHTAAQLDDPEMLQLLTQLQLMTQMQAQTMTQLGLMDGAQVMTQVMTQAQNGLEDPGAFRMMVQTQAGPGADNGAHNGQPVEDPAEDEDSDLPGEDDPADETTGEPGPHGNNTDPGDPEPGNDTPGTGQQGNGTSGGNEDSGTPGPHGNNADPGDPAPGNDATGPDQPGGGSDESGGQGNGNR